MQIFCCHNPNNNTLQPTTQPQHCNGVVANHPTTETQRQPSGASDQHFLTTTIHNVISNNKQDHKNNINNKNNNNNNNKINNNSNISSITDQILTKLLMEGF